MDAERTYFLHALKVWREARGRFFDASGPTDEVILGGLLYWDLQAANGLVGLGGLEGVW